MFITILTIIYLALALFILVRFFKQKSSDIGYWRSNFNDQLNKFFVRKSEINKQKINYTSSDYTSESSENMEDGKYQPEYKRS